MNILGTSGNDVLWGSEYADQIWAGSYEDFVAGLGGDDWMEGEDGNDLMFGESGNDYMFGGAGNDTLYGGYSNNYLSGGDGDDFIVSNYASDTIYGGAGNDTLFFTGSDTTYQDVIMDYESNDVIYIDTYISWGINLSVDGNDVILKASGNIDRALNALIKNAAGMDITVVDIGGHSKTYNSAS